MKAARILGAAAVLLIPVATRNPYVLHMLIMVLMWVVLGQSWNLLGGYTGQVSFGHAAFFGIGAYTAGILIKGGAPPATAWAGL
ncbi:MAG: ABC transporter permease subunit, partial [Candidatus Aminicenantales bacterium]